MAVKHVATLVEGFLIEWRRRNDFEIALHGVTNSPFQIAVSCIAGHRRYLADFQVLAQGQADDGNDVDLARPEISHLVDLNQRRLHAQQVVIIF